MNKIYEVWDHTIDTHISYHLTLEGALTAMSENFAKVSKALHNDYKDDSKVDFTLEYGIRSHEVKE
jgi:hypothetical protein